MHVFHFKYQRWAVEKLACLSQALETMRNEGRLHFILCGQALLDEMPKAKHTGSCKQANPLLIRAVEHA